MIKIISKPYTDWVAKMKGMRYINAVTGFPGVVIFSSKETANDPVICNHEAIHGAQLLECWIVGWWIMYKRFEKKYGYKNNPFEREARANAPNLNYLKTRKRNAWKQFKPE